MRYLHNARQSSLVEIQQPPGNALWAAWRRSVPELLSAVTQSSSVLWIMAENLLHLLLLFFKEIIPPWEQYLCSLVIRHFSKSSSQSLSCAEADIKWNPGYFTNMSKRYMDNAHATSWHHEICEKNQCFRAHQGERFQPCHIRQRVAWRPASVVQHASLLSQHQSLCLSRRKESPRSTKLHGNQSIYGGTYLPSKTAWNAGTLGPNSCRLVATDVKICPKPAFDAFKCRFFNISVLLPLVVGHHI